MDLTSRNRTLASFIPMSNIDRDRVPCVRSNTIYFTVIKTPGHTRLKTRLLSSPQAAVADIKAFLPWPLCFSLLPPHPIYHFSISEKIGMNTATMMPAEGGRAEAREI